MVANWISLLLGSGVLVSVVKYFSVKLKMNDAKTEAVCHGVQALLRDRLYDQYDKYYDRGYAPKWVKENFDNMYKHYHNLGLNGVMDQHYKDFMRLPDRPVEN